MRQFAFLYGVASDKDLKTNRLFHGYLEKQQGKHLFYLWELLQPAPPFPNSLSEQQVCGSCLDWLRGLQAACVGPG